MFYTDVEKIGSTSLTLTIEAWAQRFQTRDVIEKVTQATFIFVAVDDNGKPRVVPR